MKHLLNDMTEAEKNAIREQHTGGMKIYSEKFAKLVETKLGDVKPLVTEQQAPLQKGQKISATRSVDNKTYTLEITEVQPNYVLAKISGEGTYEGRPLDGKIPFELSFQNGKLSGNMAMGTFTIIPNK